VKYGLLPLAIFQKYLAQCQKGRGEVRTVRNPKHQSFRVEGGGMKAHEREFVEKYRALCKEYSLIVCPEHYGFGEFCMVSPADHGEIEEHIKEILRTD